MEHRGSEQSGQTLPGRRRWVRRYAWLALLVPLLAYAAAIGLAYWRPPLHWDGSMYRIPGSPSLVMYEVLNRGPLPVVIESVEVAGVLPPDEIAVVLPEVWTVWRLTEVYARGEGVELLPETGWRLEPTPPPAPLEHAPGVLLVWYPTVDLRWLHCPTFRYRYLGWPMALRGYCRKALRGPALHDGTSVPPDWGEWQSAGGGVRYRLQRTEEDLFIELAPEPGHTPGEIVLNHFREEPGRGRARFWFRLITLTDKPTQVSQLISVPLRWGEPDPIVEFEIIPIEEWREMDYGEKG
jgi:hypothetical protein